MTDDDPRCERCNTPCDFAVSVLKTGGVLEDVCEDCFDKEIRKQKGQYSPPGAVPPWMRRTGVL